MSAEVAKANIAALFAALDVKKPADWTVEEFREYKEACVHYERVVGGSALQIAKDLRMDLKSFAVRSRASDFHGDSKAKRTALLASTVARGDCICTLAYGHLFSPSACLTLFAESYPVNLGKPFLQALPNPSTRSLQSTPKLACTTSAL